MDTGWVICTETMQLRLSSRPTARGSQSRRAKPRPLLTRVEVHLNDENAGKSGAQDKRCQMEARIKGHQPLSVTHKAESLDLAVDGAADKLLRAITNLSGKLEKKRLSGGELNDPLALEDSAEFQDSLRQDEFLEREQLAHDHELK